MSISGRMLIQTQDGTRTEQQLETDDALLAAYRDHFGIVLSRIRTTRRHNRTAAPRHSPPW